MNATAHTASAALVASQAPDCLILTGNNRLRRSLLGEWEAQQAASGQTVWGTPQVEPFRGWLNSLWQQTMGGVLCNWQSASAGKVLLSTAQAEQLWLDAIRQDSKTVLINRPAAARNAHKAWRLLEQWQLRGREWPHYCSHDMAAFAQWRLAVEKLMADQQWLDAAELPRLVSEMISEAASQITGEVTDDSGLPLPSKIYTVGLQALAPSEMAVLQALQNRGVSVEELPLDRNAEPALLAAAESPAEEIHQAARWARSRLNRQADSQLAIVLLDANNQALAMRQALMQSLHPDQLWGEYDSAAPLAFNFSLGDSLARQAIVQAGLQALAWLNQAQPVEQVAALLQSPYIAGASNEAEARAQLARLVLESNHPQCSIGSVINLISYQQLACQQLAQQLDAAKERWQQAREAKHAKVADWLEPVTDCLKLLGWAQAADTEAGIDSLQWQAVARFKNLLNQLPELDLVSAKTSERDFIHLLKQAAGNEMFQAQGSSAPIQVLGPLEAIGQQFDGLWVLGATDDLLPAPVRPDPYIPREWQRELQMPHASTERERAWAQSLIEQLTGAAPEVVFSYAQHQGDSPLRPAQQIASLAPYVLEQPSEADMWLAKQLGSAPSEMRVDDKAPAIPGSHPVAAAGGAKLFEDQSACAFKAFAHWRLNTRAIELPEWGLPKYELGNHLHRALEIFWQRTKTQSQLLGLADAELALHVRAAIADAEEKGRFASEPGLAHSVRDLKMAVLHPLIVSWLQLEKTRQPFSVVGKEEKLTAHVERLRLQLSIDRIDQLEDGRLVVTDYKTSQSLKIAAWNPPRPEQPQLPLYAVQLKQRDQTVAAVMFAQIAPGKVQALGLASEPEIVQGLSLGDASPEEAKRSYQPNLATLFPQWEAELNRLANDFTTGEAGVLPKDPSSCAYCDLKPLCRIQFDDADGEEVLR